MIEKLFQQLQQYLIEQGLGTAMAMVVLLGVVILLGFIVDWLTRRVVLHWVQQKVSDSRIEWDDVLWQHRVFQRATHLLPGVLFYWGANVIFSDFPGLQAILSKAAVLYLVIMGALSLSALVNAATALADLRDSANKLPLRSLQQLMKLLVVIAVAVTVLSIVIDQNPAYLLSGLGAFTAILLLVFRDTLLGLVAGVQLAANDMVRRGDWIEMSKYGADGDVIDVGLTTVKVRNWDKTITTIPTYALITDSFKNWRGMQESGGRRIKRALHLDVSSVRFVDQPLLEDLQRIDLLQAYLNDKLQSLGQQPEQLLQQSPVNGRRMTNIGTFRAYLQAYLKAHQNLHDGMTLLVRQLSPTEKGLPIEIYCFSADQRWAEYEAIQADIFDHIFAILPNFDLRPFQAPSGADVAKLALRANESERGA
ncbi:mechanosensitive ion channel family protein [Neiella marina]|uniref:Mechanosensitive ion channel family protein n=1 Tax=Neiella holothuriorum TaxID=2870530 RepID=A0ABS7ECW7_9GAMM|nr:mechanosensitive ion channel domain-containing protein [Neiella holothuriorum]MBW8190064.1 mechanosensitive ion channel family protein [Neiella holothuriorum]